MNRLPEIKCPICGNIMIETDGAIKQTKSFDDCVRRCPKCHVGASNSKSRPTIIYKDYHAAVPKAFHNNLDFTLENGLNQVNKENKHTMFSFSTSEDALSWIFIRYFIENSRLLLLEKVLHINDKIEEILLWGVPQINPGRLTELKESICAICDSLGEKPTGYSEPDIIVITKNDVVFIEVKLGANNADARHPEDFDKYLIANFYKNLEMAKQSGRYELARNWTIGNMFAGEKTFTLINLAPGSLFKRDKNLVEFEISLNDNISKFKKMSWEDVLATVSDEDKCWTAELCRRLNIK